MKREPAKKPVKVRGAKRGRAPIYSRGYKDEIAVLCGHLRENPLMSNAELRILTGFSESCVRINSGKARTIVKNDFSKKSA
jgi:hypothetical protein